MLYIKLTRKSVIYYMPQD